MAYLTIDTADSSIFQRITSANVSQLGLTLNHNKIGFEVALTGGNLSYSTNKGKGNNVGTWTVIHLTVNANVVKVF